ncbi:uncharacterized protein V1516DRAFT_677877 [Lipomyces oligophaga]|uniref:uncharacterized protein n=1 Tax=Lipomyces oligophaga TaxID=45792 RepID=UPI0034CDE3B7
MNSNNYMFPLPSSPPRSPAYRTTSQTPGLSLSSSSSLLSSSPPPVSSASYFPEYSRSNYGLSSSLSLSGSAKSVYPQFDTNKIVPINASFGSEAHRNSRNASQLYKPHQHQLQLHEQTRAQSPNNFLKLQFQLRNQNQNLLSRKSSPGVHTDIVSETSAKRPSSKKTKPSRFIKRQKHQRESDRPSIRKKIVVVSDRLKGYSLHSEFDDKYLLGDELGSGGFGFVMSATRFSDRQEVAVKFIYRQKIPAHAWINDMVYGPVPMELYIHLRLSRRPHPNVIYFYEHFADETFFILVTELHGSPWARPSRAPQDSSVEQTNQESQIPLIPMKREPLATLSIDSLVNTSRKPPAAGISIKNDPDIDMLEDDETMSYHSSSDEDYIPSGSASSEDDDNDDDDMNIDTDDDITDPEATLVEEVRQAQQRDSHDLFEMIETRKNLTERQVRYIIRQLVDALYYLESMGVYHRDIKDENILIDDRLTIKLIDFGSAVVIAPNSTKPKFTKFYGTMQYAPVEVLLSRPYDAEKGDVWALGILIFTCLTGQTPFHSKEDAINKDWDLSRRFVSNQCRSFIELCLQKDPENRASIYQLATHRWWITDIP